MEHKQKKQSPVARESLPTAVQRWLDRSLPQEIELPKVVHLQQEGVMDLRDRWTHFHAKGFYKTSPLSFTWQARFQILPGVWIEAQDGHLNGQGWGGARLWGLIPMGKRTDPEVYASQMMRNLGELPMLPTFVLAESNLGWQDLDESNFEVRTTGGERDFSIQFEINNQGDVVRAFSPARPYDVPGGYEEAPWTYTFSDHREFNGVRVPATAVARFEKEEGPWEYFRARITALTFE